MKPALSLPLTTADQPTRMDGPARLLWQEWRRGRRPDVRQFLAGLAETSPAERAAVLRVDQRERWLAGERVPAEAYLNDYFHLQENDAEALELVYGEFLLRREAHEAPTVEEYLLRFPRLGDALRRRLEVAAAETPRPVVDGYELMGELGRGGMGVVYKAWQRDLRRYVALKTVRGDDPFGERRARFRAEYRVLARLQHPNIVQIHEVGEVGGRPYFIMELVEGGGLDRLLARGPLPARRAAELTAALARAAHHAHRHGVVHRDLKPGNVLLTADGRPKITDFGLAKRLGPGEVSQAGCRTLAGAILGTPSYLAPEQAEGNAAAAGPAVDVYSLGAVLYEMLTGRPPFQGASVLETLEQVRSREPTAPTSLRPTTPRDLETICLKCLHKEPRRRYGSAEALADDLDRFLRGEPTRARPTCAWERGWKRVRRNPAAALLSAVLACTAAALLIMGGWSYSRVRRALTDLGHEHQSVLEKNLELQGVNRRLRQALAELGKERQEVRQKDEELDAATLGGGEAGPPAALYELGCVYALCCATEKGGAVDYAARAMTMLERADNAGYFHDPKNLMALGSDADLASLRGRDDFRALLRKAEREKNASAGP